MCMTNRRSSRFLPTVFLLALAPMATTFAGDFTSQPTWRAVNTATVRTRLEEYFRSADVAPDVQASIREQWQTPLSESSADRLDRLAASLAKADSRVAELVSFCSTTHERGEKLPDFAWLADRDTPPLIRTNMRLYFARGRAQQGFNDEAISWMDGLSTDDVVAPETLLFYRAVALHQLVQPDKADTAID